MDKIVKIKDIEKVKGLFGDWENNFVMSCLQGIMGEVHSFDLDNPKSAVAVLGDFRMFAGEPNENLLKYDYKKGVMDIIIPQNDKWAELVRNTFDVDLDANKTEVKHAVEEIFDVEVAKVNIMNVVGKKKRMGRYVGMTAASKKAIVTLTDSSKEIEFFQSL